MFTFIAANCVSRLSTVLISYCEKTSRLRHDSWNLRAYSLELEDGDISKSESFIHMFTNAAALLGECEPRTRCWRYRDITHGPSTPGTDIPARTMNMNTDRFNKVAPR